MSWKKKILMALAGVLSGASLLTAQGTMTAPAASVSVVQQSSSAENPFLGAAPEEKATDGVLKLTLVDALHKGLQHNLGALLSEQSAAGAEAARLRAQNAFLPNVDAYAQQSSAQVNMEAMGVPRTRGVKYIYGPTGLVAMRAEVEQSVFDLSSIRQYRAAQAGQKAAKLSYQNARELVALSVGYNYLQALASQSRVEAATAELATAEALYKRAYDQKQAGVIAGIDLLSADVQRKARQQQLLVAQNDFDKQMLLLGRVIGLADGQRFELADKMPAKASAGQSFEQYMGAALGGRSDYQQMIEQLRQAELSLKAAKASHLPTVGFTANYGVAGNAWDANHGDYQVGLRITAPIYTGTRVKAEVMQAEANVKTRQAQLADFKARVEYEVRASWLDYEAASKQLDVAEANLALAREQLKESEDRFAAGVANNIEVVQAQEARASAEESYIASLFSHNYSKLALARAAGFIEQAAQKITGGR